MLSSYSKLRIVAHFMAGNGASKIQQLLQDEGIIVSRVSIWRFLNRYKRTGTIARKEGSGRPTKVTPQVLATVEEQMNKDDETTALQLHKILNDKLGVAINVRTILRCRKALGWTFRGSAYCQLIREANKQARLEWARRYIDECEDGFLDVIWSDESTVQLESHKRYCCRKKGCRPRNKPR